MRRITRSSAPFAAIAFMVGAAILALTGCASSTTTAAQPAATDAGGTITVVASTNVYGDIAQQIGGDRVTVRSIISDPAQDPHSYQGDAQVQLALAKAQLVIVNGGGYDDFVGTLLRGAADSRATVLNAVSISGFDQKPASGTFNEHVWYDLPTVRKVATQIAATLGTIDPASVDRFTANTATFDAALDTLAGKIAALKAAHDGDGAAITEPVPLYLLTAAGLVNKTPAAFSKAIEGETDVAPDVLRQTLSLFSTHSVKLLAYNDQTTSPQTEQVLAAAKSAKIATVPVTETLPAKTNYVQWMAGMITALDTALAAN
ncbi:MAG: zinc ABC transporter substrate-binding protein [Microbacteriaceae bacterium]|nr:zinc ABC transporter substrate-binding protein [Microbacteriaceae bacterium]